MSTPANYDPVRRAAREAGIWKQYACPKCDAPVGANCYTLKSDRVLYFPHVGRPGSGVTPLPMRRG